MNSSDPAAGPPAPIATPPSAPRPDRPGLVLLGVLLAQIAFGLLALTICLPSMPAWASEFGADQAAVQLSFSVYVLAFGGLQMAYGPLSDRHGRRGVVLFGLGLAAAGSALAAVATGLGTLVIARAIQGAGSAAGMVVGRAMVQDHFHGSQRTRVMAWVGMVMGLCPPGAMVLGGQVHVSLGWRANFVIIGALALALLMLAWRVLPQGGGRPSSGTHWLREMAASYRRLLGERVFLAYMTLVSMCAATFYAFLGGAPLVLARVGVGPEAIGWYIAAVPLSYIVGNLLTSHLIHRLGEARLMRLGQVASLASLGLLIGLGWAGLRSPLAFALPLLLLGIGHGLLVPASLAGTVGVVPALAGAAAAVAGLLQQVMGAAGGYVVGLVSHDGPVQTGWVMLAFTLVGALAQASLPRTKADPRAPAR